LEPNHRSEKEEKKADSYKSDTNFRTTELAKNLASKNCGNDK